MPHDQPASLSASRYANVPALDVSRIDELRAIEIPGEPSILGTLLDIYFCEAPPLLQQLLRAIESGDHLAIKRHAHKLSGSCGNFGGVLVGAICRDLEECGANNDIANARTLRPLLEDAFKAFSGILQKELDSIPRA